MKEILLSGLLFFTLSANATSSRKISTEFSEEMLSTTPGYCSGEDDSTINCSDEEGNVFSNLLSFKTKINSQNFRKDLINISVKNLLQSKSDALKMFPELIPPNNNFRVSSPVLYRSSTSTKGKGKGKGKIAVSPVGIDAHGDSLVKSCLDQNSEVKLSEFDKDLTQELKNAGNEASIIQKDFVAQSILEALKVNAIWEEKLKKDDELKNLYAKRIKIEKELKIVEDVKAGRFYEEKNKTSNNSFLGVSTQELIIVTQNSDQRNKRQEVLTKELQDLNENIKRIFERKAKLDQIAFNNPIQIESTDFIEKGLFKKSAFFESSIKFIRDQKGSPGKTQNGDEFLSAFNSGFSQDLKPSYDGQILSRIELMLANDPNKSKELTELARESIKKKIQELDGSIKEICSTSGEKLHHFKPLVNKVIAQNILEARKEGFDSRILEEQLKQTHCQMLEKIPYVDSNVGMYAVIGAGMLATGVLAPVGLGVVVAGGGFAFATVGAIDTNDAYKLSRLAQGLTVVQLADRNRAREDLSNLRVAASWTVLDGALFPLKPFVLGKNAKHGLEELNLPSKNWPLIALGRDKNKDIRAKSTLEDFAEIMSKRLQRNLVTFKEFSNTPYLNESDSWFKISPQYSVKTVEKTVRAAIEMHPGKKVVIFELDNYDPSFLKNQNGEDIFSYTNFEVRLICKDRKIFNATAWYLDGKVLTNIEIQHFFGKHIDCSP